MSSMERMVVTWSIRDSCENRPAIGPKAGGRKVCILIPRLCKHDLTVYPGAPHSFFGRKQAEFAEASADAWRRVQTFVRASQDR